MIQSVVHFDIRAAPRGIETGHAIHVTLRLFNAQYLNFEIETSCSFPCACVSNSNDHQISSSYELN